MIFDPAPPCPLRTCEPPGVPPQPPRPLPQAHMQLRTALVLVAVMLALVILDYVRRKMRGR
jgi:hypothetical protein